MRRILTVWCWIVGHVLPPLPDGPFTQWRCRRCRRWFVGLFFPWEVM
jgi:hypothetical protein